MKHGRRHDKLKEQAYLARKDAEGYARPYRALDVAEPIAPPPPRPDEAAPLGAKLAGKARRQLRRAGVDADADAWTDA